MRPKPLTEKVAQQAKTRACLTELPEELVHTICAETITLLTAIMPYLFKSGSVQPSMPALTQVNQTLRRISLPILLPSNNLPQRSFEPDLVHRLHLQRPALWNNISRVKIHLSGLRHIANRTITVELKPSGALEVAGLDPVAPERMPPPELDRVACLCLTRRIFSRAQRQTLVPPREALMCALAEYGAVARQTLLANADSVACEACDGLVFSSPVEDTGALPTSPSDLPGMQV